MKNLSVAGLLAVVSVAGCTSHLEITEMPKSGPVTGVPYALYFDRFDMVANYRLAECAPLKLAVTLDMAKQNRLPDPRQVYQIDPLSLGGFLKTTEFEINYHPDGSVASINAKADDRSAEAISGLVKSAAGIAKIFLAGGGTPGVVEPNVCNQDTNDALDAYKRQKGIVDLALKAQTAAQADFDIWKAKVEAVGGNPDQALQTAFNNSYRSLDAATRNLASAKESLDALGGKITYERAFSWPEWGGDTSKRLEFDRATARAVFDPWLLQGLGSIADDDSDLARYNIVIALTSQDSSPLSDVTGGSPITSAQLAKGIPYRSPAPAILTATMPNVLDDNKRPAPQELLNKPVSIQQFGRIMQLPCSNPAFTASACNLAFSAEGRLTKAGASRSKAQGEVLANLLSGTVEQAAGVADAERAQDLRRANKPKEEAEAELAMLELEAKLVAARKALIVTPPTGRALIEEQILALDVDRRLIEAQLALNKARALVTP